MEPIAKENFYALHLEQLKQIGALSQKPTLLLHACCGPCSSAVLEILEKYFSITVFYYNPNIHPQTEYTRRLEELKNFLPRRSPSGIPLPLVEMPYDTRDFFAAVKTDSEPELKTEREMGERCRRCYKFRMEKAFEYAKNHGFDYFTTTLSISPYKDAQKINRIGRELAAKTAENSSKPDYLYADFKKKNGFLRSLELSKEYGLYRQDYCGCVFSMENK